MLEEFLMSDVINLEFLDQILVFIFFISSSGLFDATDPEVEDIDDIVGLCSGKFATQAVAPISQFTQDTQVHRVDPESQDTRNPTLGIESQDTVILTG